VVQLDKDRHRAEDADQLAEHKPCCHAHGQWLSEDHRRDPAEGNTGIGKPEARNDQEGYRLMKAVLQFMERRFLMRSLRLARVACSGMVSASMTPARVA